MKKGYDFSNAVQGFHYREYDKGHSVQMVDYVPLISPKQMAILLALAAICVVALIAHGSSARSMCGSHGNYSEMSPDGANRAVVYEFDCGATTDFGTHVAVQSAKAEFDPFDADEDSLVFSADSDHQQAPVDSRGLLDVGLVWQDPSHLSVYVPGRARVFARRDKIGTVAITYVTVDSRATD